MAIITDVLLITYDHTSVSHVVASHDHTSVSHVIASHDHTLHHWGYFPLQSTGIMEQRYVTPSVPCYLSYHSSSSAL